MSTLTLTQRAEEALIGALLTHPWQFVVFDEATQKDFTVPRLARVYGAMMGHWGTVAPDHIDEDLVPIAASAQVSPQYLEYLKSVCPAPLHAGAYDHLVAEASARRDLRSDAEDLAVQARAIGHGALAEHSLRVAEAIKRNLVPFDPDRMTAAVTQPRRIQGSQREVAEEAVLAAILRQHPESMTMLEILRPMAWSDPARQEMHAAMVTLAASGRDIDPLTVDWEISHARERNGVFPGHLPAESDGPSYAAKLAGIPVDGNPVRKANSLMDAARREARPPSQRASESRPGPVQAQRPGLLAPPPQATIDGHVPGQKM